MLSLFGLSQVFFIFCSCCFLLLSSFNLVPAVVQVVQLVPVTGSVDWSTVSSSPHAKVSLDKTLNPKSISVCECWLKPSGTDRSAAWMCVTGYMRHVAESAVSRQDLCKYDIIYKQPTLFIFTFFHFHCVFILPGCMPYFLSSSVMLNYSSFSLMWSSGPEIIIEAKRHF